MSLHYGNPYEPNNFQSDRFFSIIQICGEFLPSKAPDFNCVFFFPLRVGENPVISLLVIRTWEKIQPQESWKEFWKHNFSLGCLGKIHHYCMRSWDDIWCVVFKEGVCKGTNFRVFSFFSFFVFSTPLGSTAYLPNAPGLMFGDDGPACVAPWLVGHPAGKFPPTCLNYP